MIKLVLFLLIRESQNFNNEILNQGIIFIIVILILMLAGVFFIVANYKKNFDLKRQELFMQISYLKSQDENLKKDFANLKEKLERDEKIWRRWEEEKNKLNQEIEKLKQQLQNLQIKLNVKKDDVIIEYYMNDKTDSDE